MWIIHSNSYLRVCDADTQSHRSITSVRAALIWEGEIKSDPFMRLLALRRTNAGGNHSDDQSKISPPGTALSPRSQPFFKNTQSEPVTSFDRMRSKTFEQINLDTERILLQEHAFLRNYSVEERRRIFRFREDEIKERCLSPSLSTCLFPSSVTGRRGRSSFPGVRACDDAKVLL